MTKEDYAGSTFEVKDYWSIHDRALEHAARAERLLAGVGRGVYVAPPLQVMVAQVHAQLAQAYAALTDG